MTLHCALSKVNLSFEVGYLKNGVVGKMVYQILTFKESCNFTYHHEENTFVKYLITIKIKINNKYVQRLTTKTAIRLLENRNINNECIFSWPAE